MRFNPPPGWPPAPPGWEPPRGWQPNPAWPPPPPGWQLWVDDTPAPPPSAEPSWSAQPAQPSWTGQQAPPAPTTAPTQPSWTAEPAPPSWSGQQAAPAPPAWSAQPAAAGASGTSYFWTIGGGVAVFLGSLLPFVSGSDTVNGGINGGARATSAIFGLVLAGLGAVIQFAPPRPAPRGRTLGLAITLLVLSGLGVLGYVIFTAIGAAGVNQNNSGFSTTVSYSPSIGIILAILGCVAAAVGAILALRRLPGRQQAGYPG